MRRSVVTHGACLLSGAAMTLAVVLWLQRGMEQAVAEGRGASVPSGNGDVNGDGAINITDAVYLLEWLFRGGAVPEPIECPPPGAAGTLPATGQTACYGWVADEGWVEVSCGDAEIAGQDGAYQAGCPMGGRFVDNGDGTVTDTCTGLMWQQDTADVNGDGVVTLFWEGGDVVPWQQALAYCEGLSFAGHEDWRLPNVRELQGIVDYGRWDPAVDPVFKARSEFYWSSSTWANYPGYAWLVRFDGGDITVSHDDKDSHSLVRAVRNVK